MSLYKIGTFGDPVRLIQKFLVGAGYKDVDVDSSFGPVTEEAVKDWQSHHGLKADGVVGPATLKEMNLVIAPSQSDAPPVPVSAPTSNQTIKGIDTSHYEPGVIWEIVAKSKQFSMTKASEGIGGVDSLLKPYWPEMKQVGPRGAYHFYHANQDPVAQAETFLKAVEAAGGLEETDMGPILDWETTSGVSNAKQQDGAHKWFDYVEARLGKRGIVYSSRSFFAEGIISKDFASKGVWIAQIGVGNLHPVPGFTANFWQYSFTEHVVGVPQKVDGSIYYGSQSELAAWIKSGNV